jgi:hypothetical protein
MFSRSSVHRQHRRSDVTRKDADVRDRLLTGSHKSSLWPGRAARLVGAGIVRFMDPQHVKSRPPAVPSEIWASFQTWRGRGEKGTTVGSSGLLGEEVVRVADVPQGDEEVVVRDG